MLDLSFKIVENEDLENQYSAGCNTNGPSGCCTTYCTTRKCQDNNKVQSDINAWEQYLEVNAGILQY